MSRQEKYPKLSKNLSEAIAEFGEVFNIDSLGLKKRGFIESIRRNNNVLAVLELGSRKALIWTKEKGQRKLVLLSPEGGSEDRDRFERWAEKSETSLLRKRGIRLEYAPRGDINEFEWGADGDVVIRRKQQ